MQLNSNLKEVPHLECFKLALGDKKGKIQIHSNEYSPASSLLKTGKLHKEAFSFALEERIEIVDVNTLDNIAKQIDLEDNIFMNIDVQGYEDKMIIGAENVLGRVKVIVIETSFRALYEGQPLFSDIYELLKKSGFVYSGSWVSWKELLSPIDGTPLQQYSIFIKG